MYFSQIFHHPAKQVFLPDGYLQKCQDCFLNQLESTLANIMRRNICLQFTHGLQTFDHYLSEPLYDNRQLLHVETFRILLTILQLNPTRSDDISWQIRLEMLTFLVSSMLTCFFFRNFSNSHNLQKIFSFSICFRSDLFLFSALFTLQR